MNPGNIKPLIWFATNNQRKKEVNEEYFDKKWVPAHILWYKDLEMDSPVEDGGSIEANTLIKFNALSSSVSDKVNLIIHQQGAFPIFSNDCWIVIDCYDWFWAESRRDDDWEYLTDSQIAEKICRIAKSKPKHQRTARIISCYATGLYGESPLNVIETSQEGIILDNPSPIVIANMPFNSVFQPNWFSKPLSEFTDAEFEQWILNEQSFVKNIELIKVLLKTKLRVQNIVN